MTKNLKYGLAEGIHMTPEEILEQWNDIEAASEDVEKKRVEIRQELERYIIEQEIIPNMKGKRVYLTEAHGSQKFKWELTLLIDAYELANRELMHQVWGYHASAEMDGYHFRLDDGEVRFFFVDDGELSNFVSNFEVDVNISEMMARAWRAHNEYVKYLDTVRHFESLGMSVTIGEPDNTYYRNKVSGKDLQKFYDEHTG